MDTMKRMLNEYANSQQGLETLLQAVEREVRENEDALSILDNNSKKKV